MKEKIEEILESVDLLRCIETNPSNFWDSASYDDLVERLTSLIQEERKEAFGEGYLDALKWCKTMGIKDSVIPEKIKVIKQYLSSIGKDEE